MDETNKGLKLNKNFRCFRDYLFSMFLLAILCSCIYGWRIVIMLAAVAVLAVLCDIICAYAGGFRYDVTELSSVAFAWMFTFLMPASVDYPVLAFGVLVTVLLGKYAFGGYGTYPFCPVAFGYAISVVCFPEQLLNFPASYEILSVNWNAEPSLTRSVANYLMKGILPNAELSDLLTGDFAGPLGSTFSLVALACMTLLIVHGSLSWQEPVFFLLTCTVWAFVFPRVECKGWYSVLLELMGCGLLFDATFLVGQPNVSPTKGGARILYGVMTGLLCMFITRFGYYEFGICFALLITGPLCDWADSLFPSEEEKEEYAVPAVAKTIASETQEEGNE